jgi:hypothetical protein
MYNIFAFYMLSCGLLASSPALNTRTLTLVPIRAVALFERTVYIILLLFLWITLYEQLTAVYNICGVSVRAYIYIYIYNYNCNCLVINKLKSYFCGEMFDAHPMTELYYFIIFHI